MSTNTNPYIPIYYTQNYIPNYEVSNYVSNYEVNNMVDNTQVVENPLYISTNYPLHSIITDDFHNDVTYPVYKEPYYDGNNNMAEKVEESRSKMYPFYMALCCFAALSFTFGLYLILSSKK